MSYIITVIFKLLYSNSFHHLKSTNIAYIKSLIQLNLEVIF